MLDHAKKYAQYSEDNFCSNKETKTLSVNSQVWMFAILSTELPRNIYVPRKKRSQTPNVGLSSF